MSFYSFFRPKPIYRRLFETIGVDFVVNNKESYKMANDKFFDGLWNLAHNNFLLYMLSSEDSSWAIRQLASSCIHATRFGADACLSCCDLAISEIVEKIYPNFPILNSNQSTHRCVRRMVGTMRRNGGIYREMSEIIQSFIRCARLMPEFDSIVDTISKYPCTDADSDIKPRLNFNFLDTFSKPQFSLLKIKNQFEQETGLKFTSVFRTIDLHPIDSSNGISIHNASLVTGEKVSITYMSKNRQRMRKFDLIPFQLIWYLMKPIPFISVEKQIYGSLLNRLSYSLAKECSARQQLLQTFGVNFAHSPSQIFKDARKIPIDLYVAAPIPHLSSTNIMVTDVAPQKIKIKKVKVGTKVKLTHSDARHIVNFTSDLFFRSGMLIPDLGATNLRRFDKKMSLQKFGSLITFDNDKFAASLQMFRGIYFGNTKRAAKAAPLLDMPKEKVIKMATKRSLNFRTVRAALKPNAPMLLPLAEAFGGMVNAAIDSDSSLLVLTPFQIGLLAKSSNSKKDHRSFPYNMLKWLQYVPMKI